MVLAKLSLQDSHQSSVFSLQANEFREECMWKLRIRKSSSLQLSVIRPQVYQGKDHRPEKPLHMSITSKNVHSIPVCPSPKLETRQVFPGWREHKENLI